MKANSKMELYILQSVRNLGEATPKEIMDELKEHFETSIDQSLLDRILRRWKAKKVLTEVTVQDDGHSLKAWKLTDVPFPVEVPMADLVTLGPKEAEKILEDLKERVSKMPKVKHAPKVRGYIWHEIVFETIDPILGGRVGDSGHLEFPTHNGKPSIPPAWWKGFFRANSRLMDMPEAHAITKIGYSMGVLEDFKGLIKLSAQTLKGPAIYEALPEGTHIRMLIRWPMDGSAISTSEELKNFLDELSITPIRGFGANPFTYGGRIKPVEFKVIGDKIDFKKYAKVFGE